MKRRNFLKMICSVPVLGAVKLPLPDKPKVPANTDNALRASEGCAFPIGTRKVLPDGRVMVYMQHSSPEGTLIRRGDLVGVAHPNGWVQTRGLCYVKASEELKVPRGPLYLAI